MLMGRRWYPPSPQIQPSPARGPLATDHQTLSPSTHPGFRRSGDYWTPHRKSYTGMQCWRSMVQWFPWVRTCCTPFPSLLPASCLLPPSQGAPMSPARASTLSLICASPSPAHMPGLTTDKLPTPAGLPTPQPDSRADSEARALNSETEGQGSLRPGSESESCHQGPPGCPKALPAREGPSGVSASAPPPRVSSPARSKPYTCEECGRGFDWKSVFVMHHRTHVCGQGMWAPVLSVRGAEKPPQDPLEPSAPRHPRRVPSGPRGYPCEECGRSFSWKSQLVIHRKSHTGQRHHFCSDCGRGFDWKSQLVIHRKSHRLEAP